MHVEVIVEVCVYGKRYYDGMRHMRTYYVDVGVQIWERSRIVYVDVLPVWKMFYVDPEVWIIWVWVTMYV